MCSRVEDLVLRVQDLGCSFWGEDVGLRACIQLGA